MIDGLHDLESALEDFPHALVGGLAVLVHAPGHRVTEDIDSAVRGLRLAIVDRLLVVADRVPGRGASVVLHNGTRVDVLEVGVQSPRPGLGLRREASAHAKVWAIASSIQMRVDSDPSCARGPVSLPVAT